MTRRRLLFASLGALGLALYLWPAIAAPVVLWTDSAIDLRWAETRVFWPERERGPAGPPHPGKPGYLIFLWLARWAVPGVSAARSVVLAQTLLLWMSIAGTSLYIAKRKGATAGASLYLVLILFLRFRDAASAIMTEAVTAALVLPIGALTLLPPWRRGRGFVLLAAAIALLFFVRPNAGAIALALAGFKLLLDRAWRPLALLLLSSAAFLLPLWLLARAPNKGGILGDLAGTMLDGSADYTWRPSLEPWPRRATEAETVREELRAAVQNWKVFLRQERTDFRRQLLWRALHGIFGTEFYDARWSSAYRRLDEASRILAPFLLLAAIPLLLLLPFSGPEKAWNGIGPLLILLLIAQSLVLASYPRYVLPFLPVLLMLFTLALKEAAGSGRRRLLGSALLSLALAGLLAMQRGVLSWEWGQVEAPVVTLTQRIHRGALPAAEPATLHIRIAPPLLPTNAHLEILGPGSRPLYSSLGDSSRHRASIPIALPGWLLETNRREPVELQLVSRGDYGPVHYLLFPVVPPPWGPPARRKGSVDLSPATGITAGSLDWWAHPGAEAKEVERQPAEKSGLRPRPRPRVGRKGPSKKRGRAPS